MDIITQGLLGGVLAQTVANKNEKTLASFIGVFAGLIADADILIRSADDPLLNIEYHRHFSHSLLFIPFGAAIAMLVLWPFVRRRISTQRLYLFCFLGYSLSGVLDACTSYGTHLLWPFTDGRVAWNLISIIDPIFSIILLAGFILGLRIKYKKIAYIGLSLSLSYMLLGYIQLQRASVIVDELIISRGHSVEQQLIKPTLANNILWRSVYIYQQKIYVDAVRISLFGGVKIYQGSSVQQVKLADEYPELDKDSILYTDMQRFTTFSDGFIAFKSAQKKVLGDLRYSMLPMSIKPLWGITININQPMQHADYDFYRDSSQCVRETFVTMLTGHELGDDC